jgi:hypothetical protein
MQYACTWPLGPETTTRLGFDEYDVAEQRLTSHHYRIEDGHFEVLSCPCRYVWPSELDLMGQLAGMTLIDRWSSWRRAPFTGSSTTFISVYATTP